jgi:hypothetical protein
MLRPWPWWLTFRSRLHPCPGVGLSDVWLHVRSGQVLPREYGSHSQLLLASTFPLASRARDRPNPGAQRRCASRNVEVATARHPGQRPLRCQPVYIDYNLVRLTWRRVCPFRRTEKIVKCPHSSYANRRTQQDVSDVWEVFEIRIPQLSMEMVEATMSQWIVTTAPLWKKEPRSTRSELAIPPPS